MRSRSVAWGKSWSLATLLLLALIAAGPLWGPGLLNTRGGGDSPFNLMRVHQLAANLRAGVFPARWMPDAAYGFGYPFFSYYAALPYYLAAGCTLLGLDILSAIKLTQTLFFVAAAWGMYGWAKQALRSRSAGWLAAVAYTVAPYHLVNVYVRGDSLSEFAAFAFYPLILWGLDRLSERPCLCRTFAPALAYAGLIVTHNLSAFIFSPFILLYSVWLISRTTRSSRRILSTYLLNKAGKMGGVRAATPPSHPPPPRLLKRYLSTALWFAGALLVALALTAWYWLPALAETGYVQLTAQTSGYFSYTEHFRGLDLVQPGLVFDYITLSPDHPTGFAAMGLAQTALALAGALAAILVLIRQRDTARKTILLFALSGLLLSTWLITPLSRPLWDRLPALQMIQFPWRMLSVQALFTALLTGAILPLACQKAAKSRVHWFAAVGLAAILTAAGLAGLRPEYLSIAADEVTVERLQLYELFSGNIGTTIRYEYLPREVVPRPFTGPGLFDPDAPPQAAPLNGELMHAKETTHRPTCRTWTVETGAGGAQVAFPLYYWPGWRATVDGVPVAVWAVPDSGRLALTIPAGEHVVELWLGHTPVRLVAEIVSLVTVFGVIAVAVKEASCKLQVASCDLQLASCPLPLAPCILHPASCLLPLVSIALLALVVILHPRADATAADLTMDFDHMLYLHHNPGGVSFDGWRLTGYQYSTDQLAPGDTLHVTLDWETGPETARAMLRLVSPAAVRQRELAPIAETQATIEPGRDRITLDLVIPRDVGPGLYLLQLGDEARSVYLRPVWVEAGKPAQESASATFANGVLRLHAINAVQTMPAQLDLRIDWTAAESIAANYGLSLRLTDPAGSEWARLDTQPGYGFLPTGLWPPERPIHDRYTIPLPEGIPPGDAYTITAILYRASSGESVGEYAAPIALDRATLRPSAPILAHLGQDLALSGIEAPERVRQGETLNLTAYWLTGREPSVDYQIEWRLESTARTISVTLPLAPGSAPTGWPAGAWIAGRAALPIPPGAPPGSYVLSLALRDPVTGTSPGSYTLPHPVRVEGRERVWELPDVQQAVEVRFGNPPDGTIELAGYDLAREDDRVTLTLYWRALAVPDQHYMLFVHLADPDTGQPAAQVDTMPREFAYPTGMWAAGEIISDEVSLSLEDVPEGRYDIAVGWYDPADPSQRLPAVDRAGSPLPDNRAILPDVVTVKGR